jgi:hypothetical protein
MSDTAQRRVAKCTVNACCLFRSNLCRPEEGCHGSLKGGRPAGFRGQGAIQAPPGWKRAPCRCLAFSGRHEFIGPWVFLYELKESASAGRAPNDVTVRLPAETVAR